MPQIHRITETSPLLHDANCVYCHVDLELNEQVVLCDVCNSPHHVDCWLSNVNQCAIFGCNGSSHAGATSGVAMPQSNRVVARRRSSNPLIHAARSARPIFDSDSSGNPLFENRKAQNPVVNFLVATLFPIGLWCVYGPLTKRYGLSDEATLFLMVLWGMISILIMGIVSLFRNRNER